MWIVRCAGVVWAGVPHTHLLQMRVRCVFVNYLMVCKFADALRRCSVSILRLRKINFVVRFLFATHSIYASVPACVLAATLRMRNGFVQLNRKQGQRTQAYEIRSSPGLPAQPAGSQTFRQSLSESMSNLLA